MADPDMSVLWSMIYDLSMTLSANRDATARLLRLAESVANTSTSIVNSTSITTSHSLTNENASPDEADVTKSPVSSTNISPLSSSSTSALQQENERLRQEIFALRKERNETMTESLMQEIQTLKKDNDDLDVLVQQYDHTLEHIMNGLRHFATENSTTVIEIHSSYSAKLKSEQQKYDTLHEVYMHQRQRLTTLAQLLRNAFQYNSTGTPSSDMPADETNSFVLKMYGLLYELQAENRGLRSAMGLSPAT
ncbi:hypothetical protein V1512DRAFT_264951 [Lipomyces arxii]|uniref:uncharacterized protein n=1 Tax=Lipomyces arxii TaxID=56418 RepID=UPI0034CEDFD1